MRNLLSGCREGCTLAFIVSASFTQRFRAGLHYNVGPFGAGWAVQPRACLEPVEGATAPTRPVLRDFCRTGVSSSLAALPVQNFLRPVA